MGHQPSGGHGYRAGKKLELAVPGRGKIEGVAVGDADADILLQMADAFPLDGPTDGFGHSAASED